ncbi:putative ABC transporter ATP-binding protein YlmA [Stieleria maiorica]|uniref:Putative ABC transporter ATP-binding protein YlmA n=1 Tax=Stieleria maiorica TaxID=2795974 RepID=A0A5B9MFN8_9BACT|nr:ATP-binding cassette domain-containing protein [Stieleria maiorica]QEF98414.1 putative ABC transporter ATP-binding protein YlmA [Stieleria maiorica]
MDTPLIEIDDVSVFREQTQILREVSVRIPRKRHTAVLGPNGSGKSSLLKLLTRDFYPSVEKRGHQGTVRILGESEWEVSKLRRQMGIVTPALDYEFSFGRTGRMTVSEAVASGFTATRLKEFGPSVDHTMADAIDRAIETVQMSDLRHRTLDTLSTGERRRVMIARAIVHQPKIFVLDEPTNGLDMTARAMFLEILESITMQDAMTMVLVTHHLDEIPPAMNHVVLLDCGRIAFDGPKSEGLTATRISSLFRAHVDVDARADGWYRAEMDRG